MQEIKLKVTSGVIRHIMAQNPRNWNQAQIAIINPPIVANAQKRVEIKLGGSISLIVGDTHAIWHSHNAISETQRKDFESLFFLLANHPDQPVAFLADIKEMEK